MLWAEIIAISLTGKPMHTVVTMLTGNAYTYILGLLEDVCKASYA